MRRVIAITLLLIVASLSANASAESIHVSASVPYDPPTVAATITNPLSGSSHSTSTITVEGTCQYFSAGYVVSLWKNGISIGSGLCSVFGTFSIPISLNSGSNTILPRSSNLLSVYGPDGIPVDYSYVPPTTPTPTQPINTVPEPTTSGGLSLTTIEPFALLATDTNTVTIQIVVGGGATPYILNLNWGDGSTEVKELSEPGTYVFSHAYQKADVFTIKAHLTDVLGKTIEYRLPAVHTEKLASDTTPAQTKSLTVRKGAEWWQIVTLIVIIIFAVVSTFWLGIKYQQERFRKSVVTMKKRRKRSAKK